MIAPSDSIDKKINKISGNDSVEEISSSPFSIDDTFLHQSAHSFGHDLRSPLFVIRSYAYLLQKTQEKEKLSRGFEMIESATYKIENLLNSYVKLIDTYTLPLPLYTNISFLAVYQKALSLVAHLTEQREIIIQHDFTEAANISFCETQLIDILVALMDNAIRHNTDKTNLTISIATIRRGDRICLEVTDNGVGFPSSEEIIKLTRPFASLSDDNTCLGLGLALINAIAQTSKNKFEIQSNAKKGATCRFIFSD